MKQYEIENRTAVCRTARTVVWEGGEIPLYPIFLTIEFFKKIKMSFRIFEISKDSNPRKRIFCPFSVYPIKMFPFPGRTRTAEYIAKCLSAKRLAFLFAERNKQMNAIISNGDYTAYVQLPVDRRQLAGALSYLGKNHASAYDIKYNEESDQGLSFTLDCRGVVENAIAKAIPTGFRFHTFNDTIALLHNLPYVNRREFENTVKVEGLASFEQLDRMLTEAYPQSITTKYYCPLTIQVHGTNSWGEVDEDGYEEDAAFAARHEDVIRQRLAEYNSIDENNMAEYFDGNNGVSEKLRSAEWGFERRNGELYGCITVQTAGPLTKDEEQDLKEWISGQNSDGLGEGFEQREIYFEGGHRGAFMYVSFWCPDDDYFIDNQDEFEDRLMNQDMTMGGM